MSKNHLKLGLIALAGMGISANVSAQDLTCGDLTFTPEAYAAYEFVDQACLEMVDRDGRNFAKMTAQVVAQTASGTHVRYTHADGTLGPSHQANNPGFETSIEGEPVTVADLAVRQSVNVYMSDEFWAGPPAEVVAAAEPPPPPPPPPPPAPEPEPEPEPVVLPTTAGPLPWLALFGGIFLLLGSALRLSRR
jgi:hypothetical protein